MIKMTDNIRKLSKKIILSFIALCIFYYLFMVIGYLVPDSIIADNWVESVTVINELEDTRWEVLTGFENTRLDTFTDNLIFQKLRNLDDLSPLQAGMWNSGYTRYWMGTVPIIRLALVFMSYSTIRYLNIFIIFSLFTIAAIFINKSLGLMHTLTFLLSLILIQFWIFPLSLQYTPVYVILMLTIIFILYLHQKNKINLSNMILLFFIVGSLTNFFDLLTAPLLTFGMPFIIYYILLNFDTIKSFNTNLINFVLTGISWLVGYSLTWIANWGISTLVLNENVFANALNQMNVRTGGGELQTFQEILMNLFNILLPRPMRFMLLIIFIVLIVQLIKNHQSARNIINLSPIFLTIILPILWVMFMRNHSQHHDYFVYRILTITIYGTLSWLLLSIKNIKPRM